MSVANHQLTQFFRISNNINRLIGRGAEPQVVFQQACDQLVAAQISPFVWISLSKEFTGIKGRILQAGNQPEGIKNLDTPPETAISFPIRDENQHFGELNIYMGKSRQLNADEIQIGQEIATDLAFSLIRHHTKSTQITLQSAADTMWDGLLIADFQGEILYVNASVAYIFGSDFNDITQLNVSDLLPPWLAEDFPNLLRQLERRKRLYLEFKYQSPLGHNYVLAINASIIKNAHRNPEFFVATVRDIAQQQRYEAQLLTLNHLTADLVQIRDLEALMDQILKISETLLEANASAIYFIDPETKQIANMKTHNLAPEYSQRIAGDYRGLPGDTARKTLQPIFVADTLNSAEYGDRIHFMAQYEVRALLILPILFQEFPIGALTVYFDQPHDFDEVELQLGMTLAQTLAIIVQNIRLNQAEHNQRKFSEALVQAASSLNSTLEFEDVLDQILQQALRVVPCRAVNVMVIENGSVITIRSKGYKELSGSLEVLSDPDLMEKFPTFKMMLESKEPVLVAEVSASDLWQSIPGTEWVQAYAGIPLTVNDEVVGILHADSDRVNGITPKMVATLTSFGSHAATAIQNAQLFQREQNQRELAEALIQAAASINSSLELDEVLNLILTQVLQVVPCRAANFLMISGNSATLQHYHGYEDIPGYIDMLDTFQISLQAPNLAQMLQGEAYLVPDTTVDPNWIPLPELEWIKGYAGVPINIEDEVVGFLNVDSDIRNFFTTETTRRLLIFADHAATAIQNARLFTASKRRAEEMAALVTAAATVSSSLQIEDVLHIVAQHMTEILAVPTWAISNYEARTEKLILMANYTPEVWNVGDFWLQPYDLERFPLVKRALEKFQPIQAQISDPKLDENQRQFMQQAEIKTHLMIPLIFQDRAIGLVELLDDVNERVFSEDEIAWGQTLATHAAIALQNADLYQQLQDYATQLEDRVQQRTAELRAAKDNIEGILASVPDAVFVLNEENALIQANQAGETLYEAACAAEQDILNQDFLSSLENTNIPEMDTILEVDKRAYQARASQIRDEAHEPIGKVVVFRDVTRFRELDRLKSQFISDVSHELRTPLTNLTLYLGLLENQQNLGKRVTYQSILHRETERLTHLIEGLLTFSRIEMGKMVGQIRPSKVNQIVHQLTIDRAFLAAKKEIRLSYSPQDDLPNALADANWLNQALSNLLTNAINYTPAGGSINLKTAIQVKDQHNWVTISVIDTGVGVAVDEIPLLFDRFYQGKASEKTGTSGTGLGLSIAKELVTRMNGQITIDSQLGEGSTFTIWLRPV
jgi:PAS domain S-box-containing protein